MQRNLTTYFTLAAIIIIPITITHYILGTPKPLLTELGIQLLSTSITIKLTLWSHQ